MWIKVIGRHKNSSTIYKNYVKKVLIVFIKWYYQYKRMMAAFTRSLNLNEKQISFKIRLMNAFNHSSIRNAAQQSDYRAWIHVPVPISIALNVQCVLLHLMYDHSLSELVVRQQTQMEPIVCAGHVVDEYAEKKLRNNSNSKHNFK